MGKKDFISALSLSVFLVCLCVTYMSPMALAANGQTLVALDQQHAGIADFTVTRLAEIEALHRLLFIFTRRCEA